MARAPFATRQPAGRYSWSAIAITILNALLGLLATAPFTPALFLMPLAVAGTSLHAFRGQLMWPAVNLAMMTLALVASGLPLQLMLQRPAVLLWFALPVALIALGFHLGARHRP